MAKNITITTLFAAVIVLLVHIFSPINWIQIFYHPRPDSMNHIVNDTLNFLQTDKNKFQSICLENGQVYFGKIVDQMQSDITLTDIYYLNSDQAKQPSPNQSQKCDDTLSSNMPVHLIKLGDELHGPEDKMIVNKNQVVNVENMRDDSQIRKSITSYEKDHQAVIGNISEGYQAIFLDNGQVYFGKILKRTPIDLILERIYYLRVDQQGELSSSNQNQSPKLSLVKLGNELHGPEDRMDINPQNIVFTENLKNDGKVVKGIDDFEKTNPINVDNTSEGWQAVFLSNGSVYFGKITNKDLNYLTLENIYYLQNGSNSLIDMTATNKPDKLSLVKRGKELHGPEDKMVMAYNQVMFTENLKNSGKVVQAIDDFLKNSSK